MLSAIHNKSSTLGVIEVITMNLFSGIVQKAFYDLATRKSITNMCKNLASSIVFSLSLLIILPIATMPIFGAKIVDNRQLIKSNQNQKFEANRLLKKAKQHLEVSQNLEAFKKFKQALEIYRQLQDLQGEAEALNGMSTAYYAQDSLKTRLGSPKDTGFEYFGLGDGQEYFKKALAIAKKISNQKLEAESLTGLGTAVYRLSFYREAIQYYEQALAIARKIGDRQLEGRTLNYLGIAYSDRDDLQIPLGYHQQSIAIAKQIGDRKGEATALKDLCSLYKYKDYDNQSSSDKLERKKQYCQQSLEVFSQINDIPNSIYILYLLASGYDDLISNEQSISYYQRILLLAKQIGDRQQQQETLTSLGHIYDETRQNKKAVDSYLQALKFELQNQQPSDDKINLNLYFLYKYIGRSYNKLEDYSLAVEYYLRSLDIAKLYTKRYGDARFTEKDVVLGLADAYFGQKNYQQAIDYYQDSLSIYTGDSDRETQAAILLNLGNSYYTLAKYQQAIEKYQESISIFKKLDLKEDQATVLYNLGLSYFASQQYQKALDAYKEALAIRRRLDDRQGIQKLMLPTLDAQEALLKR